MKLPLVTSILLASAYASVWPYRGHVAGQSTIFVASAYPVPPVGLLSVGEMISGPRTGPTVVQGASTGPVTILTGNVAYVPAKVPGEETKVGGGVLIKGPSAGPVTLIGASDRSSDNTMTGETTVLTGVTKDITSPNETKAETPGTVSSNAVIGPSTGPIIIAGPTAVPLTVSTTTVPTDSAVSTTVGGTDATPVSVTVTTPVPNSEPVLVTDTTMIEGSSSDSTSTKIHLITPDPSGTRSTGSSNIVLSAPVISTTFISGPSGSISTGPKLVPSGSSSHEFLGKW